MINTIPYAYKGTVNQDIENIKNDIIDFVRKDIMSANIPLNEKPERQTWQEYDADKFIIFGDKKITLNSKNIEYEEEFNLSEYIMTNEISERLFMLDWKDVWVRLTVYRLGQYSYWVATVDYVRREHAVEKGIIG